MLAGLGGRVRQRVGQMLGTMVVGIHMMGMLMGAGLGGVRHPQLPVGPPVMLHLCDDVLGVLYLPVRKHEQLRGGETLSEPGTPTPPETPPPCWEREQPPGESAPLTLPETPSPIPPLPEISPEGLTDGDC